VQGRTVYEEDVHVPLMMWYPRRYKAAARVPGVGSHVDLAPTIADLTGLPAAPDWQGRSLFDEGHSRRAYFYVAETHFRLAVREANWKYIYSVSDGRDELYDLLADPLEQHNVAAQHRDRCDRLRQRLAAWTEANRRQYERVEARAYQ
jgi:arylsulfatase A-like enzyme